MRWIADFFNDLGGSIIGRGFYSKALGYTNGRAWRFLLLFLFLISIVLTFYVYGLVSNQYQKMVDFAEANDYKVVFENGVVSNMPARLKLIEFKGDTLAVWQWIQDWPAVDSLRQLHPEVKLFFGPRGMFSYAGGVSRLMMYPETYSGVVDADYLRNMKTGYSWIFFLVILLVFYLLLIPWAFFAILIFIVPFMYAKFSKAGMKFQTIFKLGMFLVSLHFLFFTITTILSIDIPYGWIINFPLYIFVVAILVKIDPDDLDGIKKPAGK